MLSANQYLYVVYTIFFGSVHGTLGNAERTARVIKIVAKTLKGLKSQQNLNGYYFLRPTKNLNIVRVMSPLHHQQLKDKDSIQHVFHP